ncbi:MAG TPA: hypothetical protein VNA25_25360 [Phycisphaerae bacterium]|nr:hypothetical protein [Phycisphaerae bacterium]
MATIGGWWGGLTAVNQWFFAAASFFSVFFLWQLAAAIMGLGGGEHDMDHDVDTDVHVDVDHDMDADMAHDVDHDFDHAGAAHDAAASVAAFRLLSIRSILAFFTLFTWAGSLYMNAGLSHGDELFRALVYAVLWGVTGMLAVAAMLYLMRRMTETGNVRLASAVGALGNVYVGIPPNGQGEVRITVGGVVRILKARAAAGGEMKSGSEVRVRRILGPNLIEVEPLDNT